MSDISKHHKTANNDYKTDKASPTATQESQSNKSKGHIKKGSVTQTYSSLQKQQKLIIPPISLKNEEPQVLKAAVITQDHVEENIQSPSQQSQYYPAVNPIKEDQPKRRSVLKNYSRQPSPLVSPKTTTIQTSNTIEQQPPNQDHLSYLINQFNPYLESFKRNIDNLTLKHMYANS